MFNYISDANRVLVNGVDYATLYVYFNLLTFENAIMSNEASILINGTKLNGVFHFNYSNVHLFDSYVKPNESILEINKLNGVRQILSLDLIAIKNDSLIKKLLTEADESQTYLISYDNSITTKTWNACIIEIMEDGTFNDTLKLKIVFGVAKNESN
jgi:hypothetical protein